MYLNQWMATHHPLIGLAVFLLFFPLCWPTSCYFVGSHAGWHKLAQQFRHQEEFSGRKWRWRSGRMRYGTHFGNVLTLGADRDGLCLSVAWLFSAGSPPLFIPWSEIEVRQRKYFMCSIRPASSSAAKRKYRYGFRADWRKKS